MSSPLMTLCSGSLFQMDSGVDVLQFIDQQIYFKAFPSIAPVLSEWEQGGIPTYFLKSQPPSLSQILSEKSWGDQPVQRKASKGNLCVLCGKLFVTFTNPLLCKTVPQLVSSYPWQINHLLWLSWINTWLYNHHCLFPIY